MRCFSKKSKYDYIFTTFILFQYSLINYTLSNVIKPGIPINTSNIPKEKNESKQILHITLISVPIAIIMKSFCIFSFLIQLYI